ncbi:glycosyltransferase [Georgenia halophila]
MRIVQVSAHFPPNFVSGGTLVPQRLAQGLAERGHDAHVYAGHLDPSRTPGSTWDEQQDGVRVRWISTTPWTAWTDRHNYDNPVVTADFARWLADVRPDVVHLHSLQTLGGPLVRVAKECRAAVVVTMHDFWWFDARQFLVDDDMRPIPVVTRCSSRRPTAGRTTVGREEQLAGDLAAADLVLAPSPLAAAVAVANGVDRERVRVDENGVDVVSVSRDQGDGVLRLLYAGGPDPMKGVDVLCQALRGLADVGGWCADLYGVPVAKVAGLPAQVRARPPYSPDALAEILAGHDVLLLPSIMRESHSILTREAMRAGLAVVTTDCIGPEAVVEDGRNGLVVPTGDPIALGQAVRRLLADPAGLEAMQRAATEVQVRSVDDQVAGLERTYTELGQRSDDDGPRPWTPRRVLFVVGIQGAPLRYRAHLPAEAIALHGVHADVRHYRDPAVCDLAASADAVVLYRVPATWQILGLLRKARERGTPILFDVDDLIFDPSLRGTLRGLDGLDAEEENLWWHGVARYRTTLEHADLYVGSTDMLCERATALTGLPSRRFSNGVGIELARVSDAETVRPRRPGRLRIGYFSGTTTHDADWAAIEPAVLDVLERHGAELVLGGHVRPTPALAARADRLRRLPMQPWHRLPALLRDVDVCLAPLADQGDFNDAKSAIKWLEAALVETPTVATPTRPFREAIENGRTGMLAGDVEEWVAALDHLLADEGQRRLLGARARRSAMLELSPFVQGARYLEILRDAREVSRRGGRPAGADPVVDDEPWSGADAWVEPYAAPSGSTSRARLTETRLGHLIVAARRTYRADGLGGVVRRARGLVARTIGR